MCRIIGKALYERAILTNKAIHIFSSHDHTGDADDNRYFPGEQFRGFGMNKWRFLLSAVRKGLSCQTVMMSHINLLPAGWLIKKLSPRTRVILWVHGIEVWDLPRGYRSSMLGSCDTIICVSEFTRNRLLKIQGIDPDRCVVLNNCLDPYLPDPITNSGGSKIRSFLGLEQGDTLMFTLARLHSSERYKGYDRVIRSLASLKEEFPRLKYVIGGQADDTEHAYILDLVKQNQLDGRVVLTGYLNDNDLADYFAAMDFYVMPSTGEGFGLVFVEAMHYGLPVIAGDKDGSVDAVDGGRLGLLVDPYNDQSLVSAIRTMAQDRERFRPLREKVDDRFGYASYRSSLFRLIHSN
jgi:glycosyltransferase involved in cell wall biosynthesis